MRLVTATLLACILIRCSALHFSGTCAARAAFRHPAVTMGGSRGRWARQWAEEVLGDSAQPSALQAPQAVTTDEGVPQAEEKIKSECEVVSDAIFTHSNTKPATRDLWSTPPRRVKLTPAKVAQVKAGLEALDAPEVRAEAEGGAASQDSKAGIGRTAGRSSRLGRRPRRGPPPAPLEGGGPVAATRRQLPVTHHRKAVLEALRKPVSIIEGATG